MRSNTPRDDRGFMTHGPETTEHERWKSENPGIPFAEWIERTTTSVQFLRVQPGAVPPARAMPGDAGFDLAVCKQYVIKPGERAILDTGLAIKLPEEHFAWIAPRSSTLVRWGLVMDHQSIIDCGYVGPLFVVMRNEGERAVTLKAGTRLAQLVVQRIAAPEWIEVQELPDTARGDGGFGSTGK